MYLLEPVFLYFLAVMLTFLFCKGKKSCQFYFIFYGMAEKKNERVCKSVRELNKKSKWQSKSKNLTVWVLFDI